MRIMGIETSCDETGIAIYHSEKGLIANRLYSQAAMHAEYGGVVPELASRDHVRKILPLIKMVLSDSDTELSDLDGIAYTSGPGLIGALMVGGALASSLGYALEIPVLGVNHMEGHLLAPMLEETRPEFPFVLPEPIPEPYQPFPALIPLYRPSIPPTSSFQLGPPNFDRNFPPV